MVHNYSPAPPIVVVQPEHTVKHIVYGGSGYNIAAAGTVFAGMGHSIAAVATEANACMPWPEAGILKNLYVYVNPNTFATSLTFDVRVGSASPAGTLTVAYGAAETGLKSDLTHTVTLALGDLVDMRIVAVGAGASQWQRWSCEFYPT